MPRITLLSLLAMLSMTSLLALDTVAVYQRDFSLDHNTDANAAWKYYWNQPDGWQEGTASGDIATGTISTVASYTLLEKAGDRYTPDGDVDYTNNAPASFLYLTSTGGHPGGTGVNRFSDRYCIAAYTVSQSGNYQLSNSHIVCRNTASNSNGHRVSVLVNDELLLDVATPRTGGAFNIDLGALNADDVIYVAVGANRVSSADAFLLDYAIETYNAKLVLPDEFSGSITTRRDTDTKLWGWVEPNATVKMTSVMNGGIDTVLTADSEGYFETIINLSDPKGNYELTFASGDNTKTLPVILEEKLAFHFSGIFADHMVIQRNADLKLWGWTFPNATVKLTSNLNAGIDRDIVADADGYFETTVQTPDAGGPYHLSFTLGDQTKVFNDVMCGDVWLVSGQSNMRFGLASSSNATEAIANSNHPNLRLFEMVDIVSQFPLENEPNAYPGSWLVSSPSTSPGFSAVGYFFGSKIMQDVDVPVGVIQSAVGGTPGEAWVQKDYYERMSGARSGQFRGFVAEGKDMTQFSRDLSKLPTVLYNGMISQLSDFPIKGALWYQGEANHAAYAEYRSLLSLLMQNWRENWGYDFPFYIAQLAAYGIPPVDYAYVRETQYLVSQNNPNSGMSTAIDIGDSLNIHPHNKSDVGHRLALLALHDTYGRDVVKSGPLYSGYTIAGNKVKIGFEPGTAKGMELRSTYKNPFRIKGDGEFVEAQATVVGDSIEIWANGIDHPTAASYAFETYPAPNLFNGVGLPAVPFRTNGTVWTDVCITEKTGTTAKVRLLGQAVDGLTKEAFYVVRTSSIFGERLTLSSVSTNDNGRTYDLTISANLDLSNCWIYLQDELVTSGVPVPFEVTTEEYNAEVLTFSVDKAQTMIDVANGFIYVSPEDGVDLGLITPQYTVSDKASADISSSVDLNDVLVFTVTSEYGNRKKWTVVNTSVLPVSDLSNKAMKNIRVHPTLVRDYTNVTGLETGDKYALYDSSGVCITKGVTQSESLQLNYTHLLSGFYYIVLESKGALKTIKL